ncbi:4'-phosphopantetheinyl transferase family protein [Aeromicrobium fastidiosum]|uniref:4'-phosphopantetheinyl transferase superfamily protein n=1 Tax=Aeromicrobium fastidiosum TaxID=52699 RepID=A0A641ASP9_9ACTN|nr:4'-phosphopantetheinyl transferase superfamily protein [Aeromicrobium fastidiosum]KAA1380692.1 4'-phosphopantetheinyl transferase superfamily protein [Aeromicrobium fastidiosum]MBP2390304.1 4'-phosphopantetheinyl transferase [Aeromicrobium fastidiosum]
MDQQAVWRFVPVAEVGDALVALSCAESSRAALFRHQTDRTAYVAAHRLVRECAGALLGVTAGSLVVESSCPDCGSDEHGVPRLAGRGDVSISLSHTRGHVAAVAHWVGCGIDVERLDRPGPPRSALTVREQGWIDSQEEPRASAIRVWVRKEALIKSGVGTLDAARSVEVVDRRGLRDTVNRKVVHEWSVPGAVGAVALGLRSQYGLE